MTDMNEAKILILGGTGTLGQALTKSLLTEFPKAKIAIFSRDEHKQAAMKKLYPQAEYILGDIRNGAVTFRAMASRDIVFHVAALKHVDILEENPLESIETNVDATANVADLATMALVKHFIFSSTDKAVDPINVYGYSKALAEKVLYDLNRKQSFTKFSVYRWGNVIGSQGSVVPFFVRTLKQEGIAYVTDLSMTRFWLPIDWAVNYMLRSFPDAYRDRAMICPNMKAATIVDVVKATAKILGIDQYKFQVTGIRAGEKIHEVMSSQHSRERMSSDNYEEYSEEALIDLLRPVVEACA